MYIKPKKSLGQNFLVDKNIRKKIISACDFSKEDIVLEIGAGRGELTQGIAASGVKKIYAVEVDQRITGVLKDNLQNFTNIEIVPQDILKFNFDNFFKKEKNKIKVIGNIPYYISTPIIEHLFCWRAKIDTIFLTIQKELAERIAASPGSKKYGSLSCFIQYCAKPQALFVIRRNSFFPVPKVDSVFLKLKILPEPPVVIQGEEAFFKIIRSSFNQRRKTLRNSLKGVIPQEKLGNFFREYGINTNARAEELSLQDFAHLSECAR
jgi:16S rRNA (adenine1518-N6/adenine1519-N6)-dimethyltransferase